MPANERKTTAPSPLQETITQSRKVYKPEQLPVHETFGAGLRFRFGPTTCDVYPTPKAEGASPLASIRAPSSKLSVTRLATLTLVPAEEGEAFQGILLTSPRMGVWVKPSGSYVAEYNAPDDQAQPLEQQAGKPAITEGETTKGKERQRVKVSGFFGKVIDGFPHPTEGEEKRMIYKLLIGNKAAEQPQEGKEKIDWTTVTALEPHVVRFLNEHLQTFEKRKTRLHVEGYYQEVEKQLLRRGVKKTQELYALNLYEIEQEEK